MAQSTSVGSLPMDEECIRSAIKEQIHEFGMEKLTSRIVREKLKEKFNVDFSGYKVTIDKITMDVIERSANNLSREKSDERSSDKSRSDSESDDGVVFTDKTPRKRNKSGRKRKTVDSNADLVETGVKKRRGAAVSKQNVSRKKSKNTEGTSKPRKKGPYSVYCALSDDLAALVGKKYMRRCDVIKAMWSYFRSHCLLDPKDKRYVLSDEVLMKIFKKRRFLAFGIMKDLANHIVEPKFLNEEERAALELYEKEEEARREAESDSKANRRSEETETQESDIKGEGNRVDDENGSGSNEGTSSGD